MKAYIGLGSNLGEPKQQLQAALIALDKILATRLVKASQFYLNPPVGFLDQSDFVNAVAEIETDLLAADLLQELQTIENASGRVRTLKNGPRTLDLDLLLYGEEIINTPSLQVPHPFLKQRSFVVYPLAEIASQLVLPCGTAIQQLLSTLDSSELRIIN